MARYVDGPMGPFSGKVGNIVGSYWKGRFVMRSAPDVSQVVPTPARLLQQQKFAIMSKYLNPLKGVINVGFAHDAELRKITPRNVAMSVNMANAMNWNGSAWEVVFDDVQLSRGAFLGVEDLYVGTQGNLMKVSWIYYYPEMAGLTSTGKEVWTSPLDRVIVAICNTTTLETLFFNVQRDAGAVIEQIPAGWVSGQNIEAHVVTIPEIIAQYVSDPTNMTEEEQKKAREMYGDGFGVSNTVSGNAAL